MARVNKEAKEIALRGDGANAPIPFGEHMPDYLQETKAEGLEGLGKEDFKIPRIKLLQPLNPEIQTFQGKAIPGEFWHTGANISLGDHFNMIVCAVNKRVIVWAPREMGGGMLALSRNGHSWDIGGNTQHQVKIKNVKNPVVWDTKDNVDASGLLEWGTYNPDDESSGPAAQLAYEYLVYLPDKPELSPVVFGLFRTALPNARQFNTSLLMLKKPTQSVVVKCFAEEKSSEGNEWWVPQFELKGWAPKDVFDLCKEIYERNKEYQVEYEDEHSAQQAHKEKRAKETEAF